MRRHCHLCGHETTNPHEIRPGAWVCTPCAKVLRPTPKETR